MSQAYVAECSECLYSTQEHLEELHAIQMLTDALLSFVGFLNVLKPVFVTSVHIAGSRIQLKNVCNSHAN
jgi:hypothetical protein